MPQALLWFGVLWFGLTRLAALPVRRRMADGPFDRTQFLRPRWRGAVAAYVALRLADVLGGFDDPR